MNLFWRSTITWLGLFALAFINGALRELAIKKFLTTKEIQARQLSCASGVILWTTFVWIMWNFLQIKSITEAAVVGTGWLIMTFLTETFLLNRLISELSWKQISQSYNVAKGELWGLVLLWIGILPLVLFQIKQTLRV